MLQLHLKQAETWNICHKKVLYKYKYAFFQNMRQVPLSDN